MIPFINIGPISIPTFFLIMSIAMSLAPFIGLKAAQKLKLRDSSHLLSLILSLTIAGILGARLLHIIYEEPTHYLKNPWKVLSFWEGGLVFYGGLLLGLGYLAYKKWKNQLSNSELDALALTMSPLYAIGRMGCFFNGCCYGSHCDLPFGFHRHPTQLYSVVAELILFAVLWNWKTVKKPGAIACAWIAAHCAIRFGIEFLRGDYRGPELGPFSISQYISLILIAASIWMYCRLVNPKA